jgi:hypothetical protein
MRYILTGPSGGLISPLGTVALYGPERRDEPVQVLLACADAETSPHGARHPFAPPLTTGFRVEQMEHQWMGAKAAAPHADSKLSTEAGRQQGMMITCQIEGDHTYAIVIRSPEAVPLDARKLIEVSLEISQQCFFRSCEPGHSRALQYLTGDPERNCADNVWGTRFLPTGQVLPQDLLPGDQPDCTAPGQVWISEPQPVWPAN